MGGVERQNLPLAAAELQPGGLHRFDAFLPQRPFLLPGQPDHLHGEGAAAAHYMAGAKIIDGRPRQGQRIHPGMPPERPVLKLDQRRDIAGGNAVGRRKAPLPVLGDAGAQQLPFGTLQHGGVAHVLEQFPRQAAQPGQEQGSQRGAKPSFCAPRHKPEASGSPRCSRRRWRHSPRARTWPRTPRRAGRTGPRRRPSAAR